MRENETLPDGMPVVSPVLQCEASKRRLSYYRRTRVVSNLRTDPTLQPKNYINKHAATRPLFGHAHTYLQCATHSWGKMVPPVALGGSVRMIPFNYIWISLCWCSKGGSSTKLWTVAKPPSKLFIDAPFHFFV